MIWVYAAIASHFLWAIVNVWDKFLLVNKVKSSLFYLLSTTLIEGALALILLLFTDFTMPSFILVFWIFLDSIFYLLGNYLYMLAAKEEDITRINIFWNMIPIFSFFIAWVSIGETLRNNEFIALLLLLLGSFIAAIHIKQSSLKFSKAFILMLFSCLSFSISVVIIRYVVINYSYFDAFVLSHVFFFLDCLILFGFKGIRKDFIEESKQISKGTFGLLFGVAAIYFLAVLINYFAVSKAAVSLVYSMEGFQVLFVFVLTILISLFTRINLKEEMDKKNFIIKFAALVVMLFGLSLL